MRVGTGYDVHRLAEGRRLILGGMEIPFSKGLMGHSDADVLLHAICDALLGAAALGDIGQHFPDSSQEFKDIDSRILLQRVDNLLQAHGWRIENIDSTLIAQSPRLAAYIPAMCINIADILKIEPDQVSVKATTTEGLGWEGQGEGIAAQAVVLINKVKS
ncbi:MAG: 2-C-methyl-D-erythritol 2,4-cyclodiphosphate synthase [Syntrophomonadaceae bacterium]|nr:2-C-methyl-D-erythritol 2,4-cyclodiphosphate synthase [Syntrophomonadaceae bacterium]